MEFFGKARLKIGNSILTKRISRTTRKKYYSGIAEVKTMGLIWDASRPEEFQELSRFHQRMNERNIDLTILAYYPGKELPNQLTAIRYLTCMRKKDINFFYRPVSGEAESFITKKFDVLIDINFERLFPLYYITALSSSKFKVGLFDNGIAAGSLDLMMDLKKPVKIDNYLNEVINYLEMIKS